MEEKHTHAGTAEDIGVGVALDTNAENIDTRGVNIDRRTEVGERGTLIGLGVNSTDSDGVGGRAGRGVGSVLL